MHPAGISACTAQLGGGHPDRRNGLRMMKNGQKSSLHGRSAMRTRAFCTARYSRAEHHRHDPYGCVNIHVGSDDKIDTYHWRPKPPLVVAIGEAYHDRRHRC